MALAIGRTPRLGKGQNLEIHTEFETSIAEMPLVHEVHDQKLIEQYISRLSLARDRMRLCKRSGLRLDKNSKFYDSESGPMQKVADYVASFRKNAFSRKVQAHFATKAGSVVDVSAHVVPRFYEKPYTEGEASFYQYKVHGDSQVFTIGTITSEDEFYSPFDCSNSVEITPDRAFRPEELLAIGECTLALEHIADPKHILD